MNKVVDYVKHLSRSFHMSWVLTNSCNYSCKDCITANDNASKPLSSEEIDIGLTNLANKINELSPGKCHTRFLGGEPTLVHNLAEKINTFHERLNSKQIGFCLQTNLSQPYEYYEDMFSLFYSSCKNKVMRYTVQTTFFPEFAEYNEFLDKLERLGKKFPRLHLSVKFVADSTNYEEINALYNQFKAMKRFAVDFYPNMANIFNLDQDLSTEQENVLNQSMLTKEQLLKEEPTKTWKKGQSLEVKFTDGDILYFRNYNHLLVYLGLENLIFKDHYCSAGFNSVRVEPDGSVYRSQAPCIKLPESKLGSVINGFEFNEKVEKCNVPIGCNCMNRLYSGISYPEYLNKNYINTHKDPDIKNYSIVSELKEKIKYKLFN